MPISNFTELALRAAVNTTKKDLSSAGDQFTSIKDAALKRVQELVGGNSTLSNMSSQMDLQSVAINAAIQGLELSYFAIKGQLDQLKDKRLSFDKERQAGIATFLIPTNKEENTLSKQERIIKSFIELINKNASFSSYFGIQTGGTSTEITNAEFYSVLPFYRMSDGLVQPVASDRAIDKQRIAISLFFKSALPEAIADIDNTFQNEIKFFEFWKAAFKKENYLNDLRSQRFIMMCLANLLWNLQHPVDPETGFPLSIDKNIELCRSVGLFLNKLLNSAEKSYIKDLTPSSNDLLCFVRKIEMHVKSLRSAFIEEQLYELNIDDLTNSAHHTLRVMDKSIFELIYSRTNPITKKVEPDAKAAEELVYTVSYMTQLLAYNTDLIKPFSVLANNAKATPFINSPPSTIIDVLIIFIHSTTPDKEKILEELGKNDTDSGIEFTETLKEFDRKFIKPIKNVCKKELDTSLFNKKRKEVAALVARRLVPLITLVLEDYRIELDAQLKPLASTPTDKDGAKRNRAKDQVSAINKLAEQGGGYYVWELSPFIMLSSDTEEELDKLPKHQYRFTQITKLLDSISEIVKNYRTFLQLKSFQQFLINCLNKIKLEYNELEGHIDRVDICLTTDKAISRSMQAILGPMTKDITNGLDGFSAAFSTFEHTVSAPDFTEQQKMSLSSKIDSIHQQFLSLFGEDSGILSFVDQNTPQGETSTEKPTKKDSEKSSKDEQVAATTAVKTIASPVKTMTTPKQAVALHNLIAQCIDALSFQSKCSGKGAMLNSLLRLVDEKTQLTEAQITLAINELARITLSYRPTYFFQAAYGETRSAKALLAGIKDSKLNTLLPVASVLLGKEVTVGQETDAEIIQRLRGQRAQNQWQESSDKITAVMALS